MKEARIYITLKEGIADPRGKTVEKALKGLGYKGVRDLRIGKFITLKIALADEKTAQETAVKMCEDMLANPVIEDYRIEVK